MVNSQNRQQCWGIRPGKQAAPTGAVIRQSPWSERCSWPCALHAELRRWTLTRQTLLVLKTLCVSPSRLKVPGESIRLDKRRHMADPEPQGLWRREEHLHCPLAPVVMDKGDTKGTSPKEKRCSQAEHPFLPHSSDPAEVGRGEESRSWVQAVGPVLAS